MIFDAKKIGQAILFFLVRNVERILFFANFSRLLVFDY